VKSIRWTRALAAGMALAFSAVVAAELSPPRQLVQETVTEVLVILEDDALPIEEQRRRVTEIAYSRFDFPTMSRLVLARNWKRLDDRQKADFEREFKQYLANQYGDRIDRFDQQKIEVTGERQEPRGDVTVKTVIRGGEFEGAFVDYRLRERNGQWKVIDVVIEGISLVSNYRDQFKSVISSEGPDGLLRRLREKNAKGIMAQGSHPGPGSAP